MKRTNLLLALLFSLTLLTGCAKGGEDQKPSSSSSIVNRTELTTEITDATKLNLSKDGSYEGKVFSKDGIGKVEYLRHVDGDTTWFKDTSGFEFSFRYDGIDTPESTKNVEPWGHQASNFTKEKLESATEIVLQRDCADFQTVGNRLMGLVWLKDASHTDFYCLNLLIVEQAYSKNRMYDKNSLYLDQFLQAGKNAEATGKRVHGKNNDPDYDYSRTVKNVTVEDVFDNFQEYYDHTSKLRLTAKVTRLAPQGFYVSSVEPDEETGESRYLYAFTFGDAFGTDVVEGTVIQFYCGAGEHMGNKQLINVDTKPFGSTGYTVLEESTYENIKLTPDTDLTKATLLYAPVEAELEVVGLGNPSENSGDCTLKCNFAGTKKRLNVRIPKILLGNYTEFYNAGTKITVRGVLDRFQFEGSEPEYQIKLCLKGATEDIVITK